VHGVFAEVLQHLGALAIDARANELARAAAISFGVGGHDGARQAILVGGRPGVRIDA
jgi:hypothetical protein